VCVCVCGCVCVCVCGCIMCTGTIARDKVGVEGVRRAHVVAHCGMFKTLKRASAHERAQGKLERTTWPQS
jgi:hypothetical protein